MLLLEEFKKWGLSPISDLDNFGFIHYIGYSCLNRNSTSITTAFYRVLHHGLFVALVLLD